MVGPEMSLTDLIEGLRTLNAPNQGMSYHSGGYRRGSPKYDAYTGKPLTPRYDPAEMNVYGERAQFLHRLIENGEQLAASLALLPGGAVPDREAIARVIDPWGWDAGVAKAWGEDTCEIHKAEALAKADDIIAMLSTSPKEVSQ